MPTLRELVLMGQTRIVQEDDVNVTNAAGGNVLVKANPMRVSLTVVNNDTANDARMTRKKVPTTVTGLPLEHNGGFIGEDYEVFGKTIGDERRAIFATAAGVLYVEDIEAYLLPGQTLVG